MKPKRWISLLVTLALCLGLLPGAALAETDTSSTLPEGYQQMYFESDSSYTTNIEFALNYSTALNGKLFSAQNSDSSIAITSSALSFSTTGLGTLVTPPDGNIVWDTYSNAVAGTSGFLLFESETEKYAIAVSIYAPSEDNPTDTTLIYDDKGACEFTVNAGKEQAFTFPPHVYINGTSTRLVAEDYTSNYTFTCDSEIGTLFWYEKFDELAINTTTATPGATGKISATSKTDPTKVYTCTVTVKAAADGGDEGGSGTEGDDPAEVGLKLCTDEAGSKEITANLDGSYTVYYDKTATTADVVYLHITGDDTAIFAEGTAVALGPISSELSDDKTMLTITHGTGDSSGCSVNTTLTVGGQIIAFKISFVPESDETEGGEGGGSTGTTFVSGVYTTLTDGQLSGLLTKNEDLYTVSYTSGQALTIYYYDPELTCTSTSSSVEVAAVGENMAGVYSISLKAGQSGSVTAGFSLKNGEQDAGGFRIEFIESTINTFPTDYAQMYYQFVTGQYATDIEVHINSRTALIDNLFSDSNGTTNINVTSYTFSFIGENLGAVVDNGRGWDTNSGASAGASGYLCAVSNSDSSVKYAIAVAIRPESSSGNGDGGSSGDTLLEAAHTLEENEKYSSSTINEHMGEFTLPGDSNTYYMVPSSLQSSSGTDYPHLNGDSSSYSAETRLMFIEFWVAQGQNNYARVKDTATLAKIQEAFGDTLKMELLAAEYYQSPLPTEFPATYATTEVESWREPIKAKFDTGSAGTWVYCASGTLNEGTDNETVVTAEVRSSIWFRSDVTWSPTVGSGSGDVITQVNNYLAGTEAHNVTSQSGIIIELPAGTYYGYIIVPRDLAADSVTIAGNGAEGENATILRGGVQGENRRTHVRDIHFIGGGSGNGDKEWKNFSDGCGVNNGKDNYAFYGDCGGNFRDCVFENYYCAVLTTGETKTGVDSLFKENQTAVCYNSTDWGGIGDPLANNVYQNNEVAIHFVQFTNQVGLSILSITGSCFVDNKTDIRNDIKRNIYVPGNYFAETKEGVETVRECQYLPKANGNKEKVVHYYPQSANRQFNVWIYDMSFYKHDPVVSANLAATYKIPAEYLTKSVTVMNEDETLAVWIFGKEGEE